MAIVVPNSQNCPRLDQQLGNARKRSERKGCAPAIVLAVHVGSVPQQVFHNFYLPPCVRLITLRGYRSNQLRTATETSMKERNRGTGPNRVDEGGPTVIICAFNLRALCNQQFHQFQGTSCTNCIHQRRLSR